MKLTFKEADELSPVQASEHAFSRSTESLWLALEKRIIKQPSCYRTDIPFFAFPKLTDLSGRMLQSALLLSQLVVFKSEILFAIARGIGNLDDITEIRSKLLYALYA